MHIRIFARGAAARWGLGQDAGRVESVLNYLRLRGSGSSGGRKGVTGGGAGAAAAAWNIEHCDPVTWGNKTSAADLHIYLEQPCRLAMPWATYNVVVVNPEWWAAGWDWTFTEMDLFVFKCDAAAALFPEVAAAKRVVLPWRTDMPVGHDGGAAWSHREDRFLYVVGSSQNKLAAARTVVAGWRAEWPPLEVWTTPAMATELGPLVAGGASVEFQTEYRSVAEKAARQVACKWHVVASVAEGFGFTMAEAVCAGAPVVHSDLPVFAETWGADLPGRIECTPGPAGSAGRDCRREFTAEALAAAVTEVMALTAADVDRLQHRYALRRTYVMRDFIEGWMRVLKRMERGRRPPRLPEPLPKGAPPLKVGVITVTRNRPQWWTNMVQNVAGQRWPLSRLEWLIVDDGDGDAGVTGGRLEGHVEELQERCPGLVIRYVGLAEPATVGAKRNMAVAAAGADVDLFVCMDDDDHYPPDSIARRVAWMTRPGTEAVACAALPMYDTTRYISAMNVPPLTLSPAERVSEATMAFTRRLWEARPFPDVAMAEGEGFFAGRDAAFVEIPPYGVIVSFIHQGNTSSRRVPEDQEPNGCHYGFSDEYFRYIHEAGERSLKKPGGVVSDSGTA